MKTSSTNKEAIICESSSDALKLISKGFDAIYLNPAIYFEKSKKIKNRKYYLHQKIKKLNFKYNSSEKTIYIPFNNDIESKYIEELKQNFNYSIQITIV